MVDTAHYGRILLKSTVGIPVYDTQTYIKIKPEQLRVFPAHWIKNMRYIIMINTH